ncbi:MAG: hypothetical protein WC450_10575 [Candidatus Omnitrophota bacterium]
MSNINNVDVERLLTDKRVIAEIERHLWIESEKAGHDIGYERAKEEWLRNFSGAWMKQNMPEEIINAQKAARQVSAAPAKTSKKSSVKRRRAKSYI